MAKVKMLIDQSLETPWSYLAYYNRLLGDIDEKSVDGKTIERVKKKSHLYILNNGNNWFSDYFWIYIALSFSSSWLKILAKMVLDHFVILQLLALRNMSFSHCRVTEGPWRMHHARQADRWMNAMFWKGTWQMVSNERVLDSWYPMKGHLTHGIQNNPKSSYLEIWKQVYFKTGCFKTRRFWKNVVTFWREQKFF